MTTSLPISPWRQGVPPGAYEQRPSRVESGLARLDRAAFIGLAERGPLHTPVDVVDWPSFQRVFGDATPGLLLPDAVRLYFLNGGRHCLVVRCLDHAACSTRPLLLPGLENLHTLPSRPLLAARNPGAWASGLRLRSKLRFRPVALRRKSEAGVELVAPVGSLEVGDTLRLLPPRPALAGSPPPEPEFHTVEGLDPEGAGLERLRLSPPPAGVLLTPQLLAEARLMRVTLEIWLDGRLVEQWPDAALHPDHPRFLPRLLGRRAASEALRPPRLPDVDSESPQQEVDRLWGGPEEPWGSEYLRPSALLQERGLRPNRALVDRGELWSAANGDPQEEPWDRAWRQRLDPDGATSLGREHFFDPTTTNPTDALADVDDRFLVYGERPGPFAPTGALNRWDEAHPLEPAALICLPDLLHPSPTESFATPPAPAAPPRCFSELPDRSPVQPNDRARRFPRLGFDAVDLLSKQKTLVQLCEQRRQGMALLDLPLRLAGGRLSPLRAAERLAWVAALRSERAALYTPWLRSDRTGVAVTVPPTAVAAGMIARLERQRGVWRAPANATAQGVFASLEALGEEQAGALHEERINGFRRTPAGLTLLGSRTTSTDPQWTHLSVRRLMDWLGLQIQAELAWAPFEPNGPLLWDAMVVTARRRLRQVFNAGGLAGVSEAESFFVRCDDTTTTAYERDAGRVVLLVGVAPAVPAEFLVFRLLRQGGEDPGLEVA